jgi:hypothetical protein
MKTPLIILFSSILLAPMAPRAISAPAPVSTAVFDVDAASPSLKDRTAQFSALLFAGLSTQPGLALVERSQIDSALGELSMGASGLVDPSSAAKLGRLTGAKVLVLARAVGTTGEMTVVAKVIGTETGRVYAASQIVGSADVQASANSLSDGIAKIISGHAGDLLPPTDTGEAREARLRAAVAGKVLPAVTLAIPEQHITRPVRDPAAQTEIARILIGLGFPVYDLESADKAAIRITGEAVSEQGSRHGDFVSCRARVEVKVVEVATGRVLLQDSQTEVAADISEVIAAKTALEHAGAKVADRIVAALAH